MHGMHEAHGEQNEIGLDLEFGSFDRLHLVVHAHAFDGGDVTVLANDTARHHGEIARGAFRLAR